MQGLRMIAVLAVFANHLVGWPRGGSFGVDVFFVISGLLITGSLLRSAQESGKVAFGAFYWNRVRRIVPAATVVLILTYLTSLALFLPIRAAQIGRDARAAVLFMANWHFANRHADYFAVGEPVSPLQHYWSLSVEEQFYFVWPAVIFVVGLAVAHRAWTPQRRTLLAGTVMGVVVTASWWWAVHRAAGHPVEVYFDTFARAWELGAGALLAIATRPLTRVPTAVKPVLSWAGLVLIAASVLAEPPVRFCPPWALLPVTGAALVIAAGVGGEPGHQAFLRNPVSIYIGDISYSLYLVHWPVIVLLSAVAADNAYFVVAAAGLTFGLAIGSYHFVENPLRRVTWGRPSALNRPRPYPRFAALGAVSLLVVALCALVIRPDTDRQAVLPTVAVRSFDDMPTPGPLAAALRNEIATALQATEWPQLDPTMDAVVHGLPAAREVWRCGFIPQPSDQTCTFGDAAAPTKVVLVGDSIAMTYAGPLRQLALDSRGRTQVRIEAAYGCHFIDLAVTGLPPVVADQCPDYTQHRLQVIDTIKPDVVIVSNYYIFGTSRDPAQPTWSASMRPLVNKIKDSTVVFIPGPPDDKDIKECYSTRSSVPQDCVSQVLDRWRDTAAAERDLAEEIGAVWVDPRPWFCSPDQRCPSFVGTIPVKFDPFHMTPHYGQKITPVIGEALMATGVM
ncbi:hypothetical protein AWC24_07285 [Mycolicibacter senuensis]|uniref:Acyltransferase n=1 Tax=Mycolicibacter senuensis TaxID=386913 RepID=A0A7I9XKH8_9MYCO|nr:hypothetical protein AWC24_07285 [Mycolicibacter senuensis]GFG69877.1 acyltransferase [Mycolicibacter senuensis]